MPYMHWDTARNRMRISRAIEDENERHRKCKHIQDLQVGGMRARQRGLQLLNAQSRQPGSAFRLENQAKVSRKTSNNGTELSQGSAMGAFAKMMKRHGGFTKLPLWSIFVTDKTGRVVAGTEVGQVLFDAAMMYEAMSTYQETRLIRKYLHEDPPLHPRRTLEQTNEWTLGLSWHASARDQVVYRATRPKQMDFHSIDPTSKEWRDRTRKLPRVMMIDQLWMWIIDENTIITCFPDHGDLNGYNHMVTPSIHRSIRDAIMKPARGRIHNVLDLASIIFGEVQISRSTIGGMNVSFITCLGEKRSYLHFPAVLTFII